MKVHKWDLTKIYTMLMSYSKRETRSHLYLS